MARPLHLNGGRPRSARVDVLAVVNGTTLDVYVSYYTFRVVLRGDEVRVRPLGGDPPRALREVVRRWARSRSGPIATW
jgi:hypothetical protein